MQEKRLSDEMEGLFNKMKDSIKENESLGYSLFDSAKNKKKKKNRVKNKLARRARRAQRKR